MFLFKVNHRNTKKKCEIFSKLIIMTPELLSTISCYLGRTSQFFSSVSASDFEQVNVYWVPPYQFSNAQITYYRNH